MAGMTDRLMKNKLEYNKNRDWSKLYSYIFHWLDNDSFGNDFITALLFKHTEVIHRYDVLLQHIT